MRSRLPSLPPFVIPGLTLVAAVALMFAILGPLLAVVAYLGIASALGLWGIVHRGDSVDWISNLAWPFGLGVWIESVVDSDDGDASQEDSD